MVDAGANTDCSPLHLLQFALMGEVYARYLYRLSEPRIGLLSVGGEDVKGNALTKQVFPLMNEKFSNFVGNVEADTIFEGIADVLVADGYTGNVFLKGCEGLARSTIYWLKEVLLKNPWRKTTASMLGNAFRELKSKGSAEDIGGAPLLGINGICIIGHGSSTSRAVRNAIRVCAECIEFDLNGQILQRLKETGCLASDLTEEFRKRPQK